MQFINIRTIFIVLGAIIIASISFVIANNKNNKYRETIDILATLTEEEVTGLLVKLEYNVSEVDAPPVIYSRERIAQFLKSVSDMEKYQWGKSNDITEIVGIYLKPSGIAFITHLRGNNPEYLYGYLGAGDQNRFTNYGSFRSKAMRRWVDLTISKR
ncbi:MAG: hypothetical protein GXP09_03885 [Gammaproteobacteria bacterium]|nr:hypothetical protein [Gammaproteobacteria bacterium]